MALNTVEIRNYTRDNAAQALITAFPELRAVVGKDYTFILPVVVGGETHYAKIGLTSVAESATKVRAAFDYETDTTPAQEALDNMINEREANAAAKRAERASK